MRLSFESFGLTEFTPKDTGKGPKNQGLRRLFLIESKRLLTMIVSSITLKEMKAMNRMTNIHPGEILQEEFLKPMGITAYRLAKETGIPQTRIGEIIKGTRSITAATLSTV
jgi:hypothetical protein